MVNAIVNVSSNTASFVVYELHDRGNVFGSDRINKKIMFVRA